MTEYTTTRVLRAGDVDVRLRSPIAAALWCTLTLGVVGAVQHNRVNDELRRFGRPRGAMPFAFIPVNVGAATLTWVGGLLLWFIVAGTLIAWLVALATGDTVLTPEDISSVAGLALALAPLWLTGLHTMRRIRRAQFLVGVDQPSANPWRGAAMTALLPPLGSWNSQRELNRAWAVGQP